MYKKSRKILLASSIALVLATMNTAVIADTMSQDMKEARQETQIWTTYALSPYLRAHDITVAVDNGKATLTGTVEEGVEKDLAKQIALGVEGITDVDNQLTVQPDYTAPAASSPSRSYGAAIDDATITTAVKSKIIWSKYTDGLTTEVTTKAGRVTLTGTAESAPIKDLAGRLAMNTRGVVAVDNQLVVVATKKPVADSNKTPGHISETDIRDGWITTKVKSTLMYSNHVDGTDIEVTTNAGVVTLTGKVHSGAERALAVELADNVRGVKSVNAKNLTYLKY